MSLERELPSIGETAPQYIARMILGNVKPNEIPPGYSDYVEIPPTGSLEATGFINSPGGLAITRDRKIWLAHVPFFDANDSANLWPQWTPATEPLHLLVFGKDTPRAQLLADALRRRTNDTNVSIAVLSPRVHDLFTISLAREGEHLSVHLYENLSPLNSLSITFPLK